FALGTLACRRSPNVERFQITWKHAPMLFKTFSAAVFGIDAYLVEVEVDISAGNANFMTVGLPDAAVRESRERTKWAIKNCGPEFPFQNITVNLAPADVKKEGSGFDLSIALGILGTTGILLKSDLRQFVFLGELRSEERRVGKECGSWWW